MTVQELHTTGLLFACVCDQETEEVMRLVPVQNYDLKYEGIVVGIKEAIKYLKSNRSPRILIIDLSQSDLPINDIASLSEVCEPGVEVIAIGIRNDVGIFRELVKLGIRDYLVKPLTTTHIIRSIENIVLRNKVTQTSSSFSKFGKIVSFIGTHGGAGVTTLAVNCAWLMSEKHSRRISLIDPDLQLGTISQFLDLEISASLQEILEAPERIDDSLIDRFMTQYSPHLMVMCGQTSLEESQNINPEVFDPIIQSMLGNFHYTIFDLPRSFSNGINLHILGNSNIIVLVTDLSIVGLKDSHRYLEIFKRHRTTDQQVFIIVNKKGEYHAGEIEMEDFEKALNHKIDLVIPFNSHQPLQALTKGIPFVSQETSSALTDSLIQLTDKIMGRETTPKTSIKKLFNLFSFKK
jgi:pilus assembly protein CpaE